MLHHPQISWKPGQNVKTAKCFSPLRTPPKSTAPKNIKTSDMSVAHFVRRLFGWRKVCLFIHRSVTAQKSRVSFQSFRYNLCYLGLKECYSNIQVKSKFESNITQQVPLYVSLLGLKETGNINQTDFKYHNSQLPNDIINRENFYLY